MHKQMDRKNLQCSGKCQCFLLQVKVHLQRSIGIARWDFHPVLLRHHLVKETHQPITTWVFEQRICPKHMHKKNNFPFIPFPARWRIPYLSYPSRNTWTAHRTGGGWWWWFGGGKIDGHRLQSHGSCMGMLNGSTTLVNLTWYWEPGFRRPASEKAIKETRSN